MKFLKRIWTDIKLFLLGKKNESDEKVYQEARKTIEKAIDINGILTNASNANSDEERTEILQPLIEFESAKQIVELVEKEPEVLIKKKLKKKRKKLYSLHELVNEIKTLQSNLSLLDLKKSKITEVVNPDTSSIDSRVNGLFSLLNRNKRDNKIELSTFSVSSIDNDFRQFEKLLEENSTLKRHRNREEERIRYISNLNQELNKLNSLIGQNKLEEAKLLIVQLSKSIKPEYRKGIRRLDNAKEKIKEKELEFFKRRQEEIYIQQHNEARRILFEQEKITEQQRIAREQADKISKTEKEKNAEKEKKLKALLTKKVNWRDFQKILRDNGVEGFYHFTDRSNLKSIKDNGGLFSWYYCDLNRIEIPMPGGSLGSRQNDTINGKKDFVRVAFNKEHPMFFTAQKDGRISQPVWLEIDIEIAYLENTEFSDKNAAAFASYTPNIGKEIEHLSNIRFDILKKVKRVKHYSLMDDEKPYNQAEVLVKTWIPIEYIKNIKRLA